MLILWFIAVYYGLLPVAFNVVSAARNNDPYEA